MRYDLTNTHIKIYYETCPEFEEVRNIVLQEGNWLGANYTKERLVIEKHKGFGVVYQTSTGKPMVMGGVYHDERYPANVANIVHRGFTFPEFRMTPRDMTDGFRVTYSLMKALEEVNTFDGYILTMQNRDKKDSKGWWDRVFVKHMLIASEGNYVNGGGYGYIAAMVVGTGSSLNITAGYNVTGTVPSSQSYIGLNIWDSAAGTTGLTGAEFSSDGQLQISCTYLTDY